MESEPRTWILIAIPLVALVGNLFFFQSRVFKGFALFFLFFSTSLHAILGFNDVERSLRSIEQALATGNDLLPIRDIAHWLPQIRHSAARNLCDVWLALSLGILLTAVPCNALAHVFATWREAKQKVAPVQNVGASRRSVLSKAMLFATVTGLLTFCLATVGLYIGLHAYQTEPHSTDLPFAFFAGLFYAALVSVIAFFVGLCVFGLLHIRREQRK